VKKNRRKKTPNAKRKGQPRKKLARSQNKRIRMDIVAYALGIAAFVTASIAALFGVIHYRDASIWTTCLAILLGVVGGFCWLQDREWKKDATRAPSTPAISVRATPILDGSPTVGMNSLFWMGYNPDFLCPVAVLMHIRLTNHLPTPLLIESFVVEGHKGTRWKKLLRIDTISGSLFSVADGDFVHSTPFNLNPNALDRNVKDKNIPSGETVNGWSFFELKEPLHSFTEFRFRARSLDNSEYTAPMPIDSTPNPDSLLGAGLEIDGGGVKVDLSNRRKMFFSETPLSK
jgi:hypothetical protein